MQTALAGLPPELVTMLIAAAPVAELRGSIPFGYAVLGLPLAKTFVLSVVGNLLPVAAVYGFGSAWLDWVERRRGFLHRLTDWVLGRSRHALRDKYAKYGLIALPIFVAIPLPFTGAWTGTLAAFLFGVPFRKAFPLIALGVFSAAVIVSLAVSGTVTIFRIFLPSP